MQEPPILSPNLQIDQNMVPYDDLNIQGSFGRKQTYPNDQVPTLSTVMGLDTDNKPRVSRFTPEGHMIVHPDVSSGGGGSGGLDFISTLATNGNVGTSVQPLNYINPSPDTVYFINGVLYANTISTSGGGLTQYVSIGFGDYNGNYLYPVYSDVFSINAPADYANNAFCRFSLVFPGGWKVPQDIIDSGGLGIYSDSPSFHLFVSLTLGYK